MADKSSINRAKFLINQMLGKLRSYQLLYLISIIPTSSIKSNCNPFDHEIVLFNSMQTNGFLDQQPLDLIDSAKASIF